MEGVYTGFPVFDDLAPCDLYDPRYRPFYVETATPEAKDVVLVIDSSASMTGKKFTIAKEAAKTVLMCYTHWIRKIRWVLKTERFLSR